MILTKHFVGGIIPGVERQPLKKLKPDENELLRLLERWRKEAEKAGHKIDRIAVAFEAGRDGFWLARWLRAHDIEAHVIHASSVAVSREHRRAKTDRLDTKGLKRVFLGWLRGEREHFHVDQHSAKCWMAIHGTHGPHDFSAASGHGRLILGFHGRPIRVEP